MVTLPDGPVPVFDIDLDSPGGLPASAQGCARVLVRRRGAPVALCAVDVPAEGLSATELTTALTAKLGPAADSAAGSVAATDPARAERRRALAAGGPRLTVQIATHNRPEPLRRCLDSVAALDYHAFDVIVIDNAPSTGESREVVHAFERDHPEIPVRYLYEPVAGAARAHNRGLAVAEGEWLIRTDDDVVVDPQWLAAIAEAATCAPGVECVTGLILPAELDTPAQELLEQFGGYARGFSRRMADLGRHRPSDPLFPFTSGRLGSGANIAFDVAALRARGGFDPALGPGTRATGGEDLLAVFDVLAGGGTVVYEPGAIVWHWNRRDYASLQRLVYEYGVGLAAYLTAAAVRRPRLALGMAKHAALGLRHLVGRSSPKNRAKDRDYPKELEHRELRGMLAGPGAYLAGRWAARHQPPPVAPDESRHHEVAR